MFNLCCCCVQKDVTTYEKTPNVEPVVQTDVEVIAMDMDVDDSIEEEDEKLNQEASELLQKAVFQE